VKVNWTGIQGAPLLSTFYFELGSALPQDCVDLVDAFLSDLAPKIFADADWATEPEVDEIDVVTGAIVGVSTTTPSTGSGSDSNTPFSFADQGLIRWKTTSFNNGRRLQGRMFVPVPTTSDDSNGVPSSTYKAALQSAADTFLASTDPELFIWSRVNGNASPVASASVWEQWAVLRSRRT